jgi:hypothetical protein
MGRLAKAECSFCFGQKKGAVDASPLLYQNDCSVHAKKNP